MWNSKCRFFTQVFLSKYRVNMSITNKIISILAKFIICLWRSRSIQFGLLGGHAQSVLSRKAIHPKFNNLTLKFNVNDLRSKSSFFEQMRSYPWMNRIHTLLIKLKPITSKFRNLTLKCKGIYESRSNLIQSSKFISTYDNAMIHFIWYNVYLQFMTIKRKLFFGHTYKYILY